MNSPIIRGAGPLRYTDDRGNSRSVAPSTPLPVDIASLVAAMNAQNELLALLVEGFGASSDLALVGVDPATSRMTRNRAHVSLNGELITRPFDYSIPFSQNLTVDDAAFNFLKPQNGKEFVINGAIISGNRDIGVNGSIVLIYEADSSTATAVRTNGKSIEVEIPKSTISPFIFPNVKLSEGSFINGKCDDNSVRVTIFGHFVPTVRA